MKLTGFIKKNVLFAGFVFTFIAAGPIQADQCTGVTTEKACSNMSDSCWWNDNTCQSICTHPQYNSTNCPTDKCKVDTATSSCVPNTDI